MLGYFREAADRNAIFKWIMAQSSSVDGFVLSLDTLIYGGLVVGRISNETLEALLQRTEILHQLKHLHPQKPVYASLAIMRLSNNNVNEEEKTYWSVYGELIWRWSYHSDKFKVHGAPADLDIAQAAQAKIPIEIQSDYLNTRARNVEVIESVLKFTEDGLLDRLILPQDDNAQYGFNMAEARNIKVRVTENKMEGKVKIYSGMDEVVWTLSSHLISVLDDRAPRKIYLSWHHPADADTIIPRYEDQFIEDAVVNQVSAAGAEVVSDLARADLVLAIHTAGQAQGDWALQEPLARDAPVSMNWIRQLASWQDEGPPLAFVDLAFANGGDPKFLQAMLRHVDPGRLVAYAGWNTASNSLGTVAAQIQLAPLRQFSLAQLELVMLRLVDDAYYQAMYRQVIRQRMENGHQSMESAATEFPVCAQRWLEEYAIDFVKISKVCFPWQRTFEIGFDCEINPHAFGQINQGRADEFKNQE